MAKRRPPSLLITALSIVVLVLALLLLTGLRLGLDVIAIKGISLIKCTHVDVESCIIQLKTVHVSLYNGYALAGNITITLPHASTLLKFEYWRESEAYDIIEVGEVELLAGLILTSDGKKVKPSFVYGVPKIVGYACFDTPFFKHPHELALEGMANISIPVTIRNIYYEPGCYIYANGTTPVLFIVRRPVLIPFIEAYIREIARLVYLVRPIKVIFPYQNYTVIETTIILNITGIDKEENKTASRTIIIRFAKGYCATELCYWFLRHVDWANPIVLTRATNKSVWSFLVREVDEFFRQYTYIIGLVNRKTNLTHVVIELLKLTTPVTPGIYVPLPRNSIYMLLRRFPDQETLPKTEFEIIGKVIRLPLAFPIPVKVGVALHIAEADKGVFKPKLRLLPYNITLPREIKRRDLIGKVFTDPEELRAILYAVGLTDIELVDKVIHDIETTIGEHFSKLFNITVVDARQYFTYIYGRQALLLPALNDFQVYTLFYLCSKDVCEVPLEIEVLW